jgi:hypothetical protein
MIKELPRHIVAIIVLALAIGIVAGLFIAEIPLGNREVALVILGVAVNWASQIVSYHFGTSEGSTRKTNLMNEKRF